MSALSVGPDRECSLEEVQTMKLRSELRLFLAFAVLCGVTLMATGARGQTSAESGKDVYATYCVVCHGDNGDGKGLMGIISRAQQNGFVVKTYPRDFTAGVYKFRTTPTGELPTDDNLVRTITNGIARSGMPSHKDLSEQQILDVVAFIKTYSPRWTEELPGEPIEIPAVPDYVGTETSTVRGKQVYFDMKCWECHGDTGLGDGPSAATLKDDWGDQIIPFDFTSGALKGGTSEQDLLRTFITGLDGTPMPSYYQIIEDQQQWDLVSYCLYLMKGGDDGASK